MLGYLITTRSPARDRVMSLLSMKAGLRATAMASLTWAMVTDAAGQVAEVLHVPNRASKGKTGGRTMPLHPDLQGALVTLQTARGDMATPDRPILFSDRGGGLSPATVRLGFHRLSTALKMSIATNLDNPFDLESTPVRHLRLPKCCTAPIAMEPISSDMVCRLKASNAIAAGSASRGEDGPFCWSIATPGNHPQSSSRSSIWL